MVTWAVSETLPEKFRRLVRVIVEFATPFEGTMREVGLAVIAKSGPWTGKTIVTLTE